eukprot:1530165-Rhodomonas_salina.3
MVRQTVYQHAGLDTLSAQFSNLRLAVWQRRCSNQLNAVSMSNVRGVYGVMQLIGLQWGSTVRVL